MRITDIELHEIHPPIPEWNRDEVRLSSGGNWDTRTVVVLHTDNGLEGITEWEGPCRDVRVADVEPLRGTNPARWLGHPSLPIWIAPAIYDLVGKAMEVPAYQLIGPKVRSWVPVSSWTVSQTPARMAQELEDAVSKGHRWLKFRTYHLHNVIEQTRAMQQVAPDGFKIHYDINFDNSPDEVLTLARQLAQFPAAGLIEDPVRSHDLQGHIHLRERSPLPIILHHCPLGGREAMMGVADGYMLGHSPVGQTLRRAGLYEAANVPFMMQNNGGNITLAMVVHMAAALERATLHHVTLGRMWSEDVVELPVIGGQVEVPERPGLGITLDREKLLRLTERSVDPLPNALLRIDHGPGYVTCARPPIINLPRDIHLHLPGVGDGYDLPVDLTYWHNDASAAFEKMWSQTAAGPMTEKIN